MEMSPKSNSFLLEIKAHSTSLTDCKAYIPEQQDCYNFRQCKPGKIFKEFIKYVTVIKKTKRNRASISRLRPPTKEHCVRFWQLST